MHGQATRLTCSAQLGTKFYIRTVLSPALTFLNRLAHLQRTVHCPSVPAELNTRLVHLGSLITTVPLLRAHGADRVWRHALQGPTRAAHAKLNDLAAVLGDELPQGSGSPLYRCQLLCPNLLQCDVGDALQQYVVLIAQLLIAPQLQDSQRALVSLCEENK